VLFKAEDIYLLLLAVPVTPDAFKDCGAIVQGVGHYIYFSLGKGNELVVEKGI
jgi:hypothetical protein